MSNSKSRPRAQAAGKVSGTAQWLRDHPYDVPPSDPKQLRKWRARRGISGTPWQKKMRAKYDAIIAEKRAHENSGQAGIAAGLSRQDT